MDKVDLGSTGNKWTHHSVQNKDDEYLSENEARKQANCVNRKRRKKDVKRNRTG